MVRDKKGQFSPKVEKITTNELIANAIFSRSQILSKYLDPRRDIDDECGYNKTEALTVHNPYQILYDREPTAARVVEILPKESWGTQPTVFETDEVEEETEFELAWNNVGKNLKGTSWYESESVNPVWEYLLRVDELSGIGSFGAILIGINDGQELYEPAFTVDDGGQIIGAPKESKATYIRVFGESSIQIIATENDVTNPRFGQPVMYSVTLLDPNATTQASIEGQYNSSKVHWTRMVHIADNLGSSEVYGVPRMRPVLNRLYDIRKVTAGSAEMYWKGAFPGLSIESHPQMADDISTVDTSGMRGQMEDYQNGLQRYLALLGFSAKSLAPQVVDPNPQIDAYITQICIKLGIPKRIFMGSERGQLASGQDADTWNDRLKNRQNNYLTPRVVVPFVDRLIAMGVLPQPKSYNVVWPDLDTMTDDEKATVAVKRTDALAKYVQGNVESVIPPMDYLTRVLGMSAKEAESILEKAMEAMREDFLTTPPEAEELPQPPIGTQQ